MNHNIVCFGPSLVDIGVQLPDAQYQECCDVLGVQPGDWKRIASAEEFSRLVGTLVRQPANEEPALHTLTQSNNTTMNAGSSTLGMVSTMQPELRANASLVTALAQQAGVLEPLSLFFRESVHALGSSHYYKPVEGHNPVGFVLSSEHNTEKTLAMYPGVAGELNDFDVRQLNPALVVVDAYELQDSKLGTFLDKMIQSGEFRIGLSLGNHSILTGELRTRIRKYVVANKIGILCGNELEYRALYPELEEGMVTKEGFRSHPVINSIPFAIMTLGEQGMVAQWDGKDMLDVPAHPLDSALIKNTSGAGDTTAGIIFEGVLLNLGGDATLSKAAYMATHVLQTYSSRIIATS